jgi:hypothetical protein
METQPRVLGNKVICITNPEWGVGKCTLYSPSLNKAFIVYGNDRVEGVPRFHICELGHVQLHINEA